MTLGVIIMHDKKARSFFKNIDKNAKRVIGDGVFKTCSNIANEIRIEVIRKDLIWTTRLHKSIRAKRFSILKSGVLVQKYGVQLDSMKPHFINLKKGRKITKWAKKKKIKAKTLFVKPHPFIDAGLKRGLTKSKTIMEKEIYNKLIIQR